MLLSLKTQSCYFFDLNQSEIIFKALKNLSQLKMCRKTTMAMIMTKIAEKFRQKIAKKCHLFKGAITFTPISSKARLA
jgi:hypothetical protein